MKQAERDSILREGVSRPETPRDRRQKDGLERDLEGSPLTGRPLPLRLRNFRPAADSYLASIGGPLPYMLRLREIDERTAAAEDQLLAAWQELAIEARSDEALFARRWRETATDWSFHELNDLIDRHNRFYPAESRLPMDPKTRDFVLVNGADYRKQALDADWILERFPADLKQAAAQALA